MGTTHSNLVPVNIITGFLGSGKTTVLKKIINSEDFGNSAVLINEFGDVGIDDVIVSEVSQDVVVLESGCVCCTIRGELSEAIKDLFQKRHNGDIPYFRRIILETTGLADPSPISSTLVHDPVLKNNVVLGQTLTVVDAVNWEKNKNNFSVWLEQVCSSDQIWISKRDLVSDELEERLTACIRTINPTAAIIYSEYNILSNPYIQNSFRSISKVSEHDIGFPRESRGQQLHSDMLDSIQSFQLDISDDDFDWFGFGIWLSLLLKKHGEKILRVKGVLYTSGSTDPVIIHGVQHIMHPPSHASFLREEKRQSRVIFITNGLHEEKVDKSLRTFMNACKV